MRETADLRAAADACVAALRPALGRDWQVRAGGLDWTARRTLDHIPDALLFYAAQLAARAEHRLPWPRNGDGDASVEDLVELLRVTADVVAEVAIAAGRTARAFHPAGRADCSGWLAMACDELLVHTGDITEGLELPFDPPPELCRWVVDRLFPWAPDGHAPWSTLRWANGRSALPGHPRLGPDWYWHCAPLTEWDGTVARRTHPPGWS